MIEWLAQQVKGLAQRVGRLETLEPRPALYARVYRSTSQSIANDTFTAVTFSHERWDTGANSTYPNGFWDVAAPTRLTAVAGGNYIITGHILWATNVVGARAISIRLNGATYIARHGSAEAPASSMSIATPYYLAAGDYAELMIYQNSGGALDVTSTGNYSPEFTIALLS